MACPAVCIDAPTPEQIQAHHRVLRDHDALWQSLPLVGVQHDESPHPDLELRNCSCGSTLSRPVRR